MRDDFVIGATTALYGALAGTMDERQQGLLCRADPHCRSAFHVAANELCTKAAAARDAHEVGVHGYAHVVLEHSAARAFGSPVRGRRPATT